MDLELKLLNALKDKGEEHDVTEKFRITRGAYSKAMAYAKLVTRIAGGGMECYGYSVKKKGSFDDIVQDVYFAPEQDATSSFVRVTPEGVKEAGEVLDEKGYELMGWWHSHGTFSTFHSGTDVENFKVVLHEIAPQTVFKHGTAEYIMDKDAGTLSVDNYKIEGITPAEGEKVRIVKKTRRDPFAYSFVVNARGEHYLECITKTFDTMNNKFVLNAPTHPTLEIIDVDDDVKFDIPELEWEIYEKIRMNRNPFGGGQNKRHKCSEYSSISRDFFRSAIGYLKKGGKNTSFMVENMMAGPEESRYAFLRDFEPGGTEDAEHIVELLEGSEKEVRESLEANLRKSEFSRYLDANTKFKRFELENMVLMQMMINFNRAAEHYDGEQVIKEQDKVLAKYQEKAKLLSECADTAVNAVKSLTRYAMEEFTDYDAATPHKYRQLVSNILANMATDSNVPFIDAVKREVSKPKPRKQELFLFPDRVNIANQLIKDVYYMKVGKCNSAYNEGICEFLAALPETYMERPGEVDALIEKYLLPIRQQSEEFVRFQDREEVQKEDEAGNVGAIMRYVRSLMPSFFGQESGVQGQARQARPVRQAVPIQSVYSQGFQRGKRCGS